MIAYKIYYEWNKFDILMGATDVGAARVPIIKKKGILISLFDFQMECEFKCWK